MAWAGGGSGARMLAVRHAACLPARSRAVAVHGGIRQPCRNTWRVHHVRAAGNATLSATVSDPAVSVSEPHPGCDDPSGPASSPSTDAPADAPATSGERPGLYPAAAGRVLIYVTKKDRLDDVLGRYPPRQ